MRQGNGRWRWSWLAAVALTMTMMAPGVAFADRDAALDMVRQANTHYDAGQFSEALRLYRDAYDRLDDERLLYRIGLSYENMGNYMRARQFLEEYLERDPDSPVRGRVEANLQQLEALEANIQAYLDIETDPAGAEIYLHGYMGESEGTAPAQVPVGAGQNQVTLVFPEGQRLEVTIEVGAGRRVERFFQVGTASRPVARDEDSDDVSSQEIASIETPDVREGPVVDPVEEPDGEQVETGETTVADEDVIPMPGTERRHTRPVRLDHVDAGPPVWASALAFLGILGGNLIIASGIFAQFSDEVDAELGTSLAVGSIGVVGGVYLLGRNWRGGLPSVEDSEFVPAGARPAATSALMLRWSRAF